MIVVIDRFECEFAICEKQNKEMINIEKSKLPDNAKEGDVLLVEGDTIKVDTNKTEKRKKEISELTKDLWINP